MTRRGRAAFALLLLLPTGALLAGCGRGAPRNAWQPVPLTTAAMFNGVWFSDDHNGWMVGGGWDIAGGIIGRTRDGGRTWAYTSGGVPGAHHGFGAVQFFDSLSGCMLGGDGQIFRTIDGGENWQEARDGDGHAFGALCFVDRRHGWAAGTGVVRTEDGGEHWTWAVRGDSEHGYLSGEGIYFLDLDQGWMSGLSSLMRTSDGGETWTPVTIPIEPGVGVHLRDVWFADWRHGWVVGENGTILATTDGGTTWSRQSHGVPLPTPHPRQVVHTQHGLDTLPDIEGPPPGLELMAVRFLDASRGWTVGFFPGEGRSVVLHTKDGGASWVEEARVPGEELRALFLGPDGRAWSTGERVRDGASQVLLRRQPGEL
jgi:photosystem II stability/assembly factor-like uncharacterized protein